MRLPKEDIGPLLLAMEDSFDANTINFLLLSRFGIPPGHIVGGNVPFPTQASAIFLHFQAQYTIERLIAALRDARPAVPEFPALLDKLNAASSGNPASLQRLMHNRNTPYHDVAQFRAALAKLEAAVCRVKTPSGYGTAALVAPNVVLTNFHVVEDIIDERGNLNGQAECLFDHKWISSTYTTPEVKVRARSCLSFSRYAEEDCRADALNKNPELLDYALLEIERNIADKPLVEGGDPRGHLNIPDPLRSVEKNTALIILQHPNAQPMKIDIATATDCSATRIRHNVNTEAGSSGAPIFDARLNLVAIHHAGHDWPETNYPYNQAIPLSLIIGHARQHGAPI